MPEFSPECQAARQRHQQAWNAFNAARTEAGRLEGEARRAEEELERRTREREDAEAELDRINDAWDDLIGQIRADPTLGVQNVEAGLGGPGPDGSHGVGPFPVRGGASLVIWGRSEFPDARARWSDLANDRLARAVALSQESPDADDRLRAARDAEERARDAAETAREAADDAEAERQRLRAEVDAAWDEVGSACAGQRSTTSFNGGEITVDPGVPLDDEQEVRDKLDELPDEHLEGLDEIELTDDLGDETEDGYVGGRYFVGSADIELFIFGHNERVLKHEVGHHVWHERLDDEARREWEDFYDEGDNRQTAPTGKMPTGYATTEVGEGFAESYERFYDAPETLHPDTRDLIRRLLEGID